MADNLSKQPIYVETDYDNIVLIDPNKIVVNNKVVDRLVDHEDLVYYANLETKVIPRTKLAVGETLDIVNSTVASLKTDASDPATVINFLQPGGRKSFDTSYTDQITGLNSRTGGGINQGSISSKNINGKTINVRDVNNYSDTQMLGITNISVKVVANGIPSVDMTLVDVQGRTLFEQGEKSIYSVFFNLPYPLFYLTIKGYYGKAIRYALNLTKFNASFDQDSGNYNINLTFVGKLTGLLSDTLLDYARVAPKMYPTVVERTEPTNNSATPNSTNNVTTTQTSLGAQKMDEVYSIYESKGLIEKGFPRLTIEEFILRCDNFNTAIQEDIKKGDFAVLNDINSYANLITELKNTVYTKVINTYLDTDSYIIHDNEIYYPFKPNIDFQYREQLKTDISAEITGGVENFKKNASFGENGLYKIGDETFENQEIPVYLMPSDIIIQFSYVNLTETDYKNTLTKRLNRVPTDSELITFKTQITKDFELFGKKKDLATGNIVDDIPTFFKYGELEIGSSNYAPNSFFDKLDKMSSTLKTRQTVIEQTFSDELADKLIKSNAGLGFEPTIRNVFAVIMAGVDTFYRLMDQTHYDAWGKKNNPKRISSIMPAGKNFGVDSKNLVNYVGNENNKNVVYPWPTYFTLEKQPDGREMYTVQYLGNPKYVTQTNGFDRTVWPEIFFTEKYLEAAVSKAPNARRSSYSNPTVLNNYASSNGLEFPFTVIPYEDPSEISFFYELYERVYLTSHYTQLFRGNYKKDQVDKFIADLEAQNVRRAALDNPNLSEKLKTTPISLTTLEAYMKSISNNGASQKYWNFERDNYTTDYIVNMLDNQSGLYSLDTIDGRSISLDTAVPLIENFKTYLESTETSTKLFSDVISLYVSGADYDTTKTITFLDDKKTIARLNENSLSQKLTLYGTYESYDYKNFNQTVFNVPNTSTPVKNNIELSQLFNEKADNDARVLSESKLIYNSYSGNVIDTQTTSIFNTPFFINSLLKGVENEKNKLKNPYVSLGYIYLNTFFRDYEFYNIDTNEYVDNLTTTLFKFSAIHQMPYSYILRYGSIWHRYKTWIDSNKVTDILDDVWVDFDYKKFYDPILNNLSTQYTIKDYTGGTRTFKAFDTQTVAPANINYIETFNTGFYPKLINDLHWYLTKKDLFTTYNGQEFSDAYDKNKLRIGSNTNSSYFMSFSGDSLDLNRSIAVNSYFQYLIFDRDASVDKNNKVYIPIPSNGGSPFNQSVLECFKNGKITTDIKENPALYNGSVRTLWGLSNYGYYDLTKIQKPTPEQYTSEYDKSFNGNYDNVISDLFAVFTPDILDEFERAFLGFCDPNADASEILILKGEKTSPNYIDTNKIKNIKQRRLKDQILNLLKVKETDLPNGITNQQNQDCVSIAQAQQISASKKMEEFLKFDCILKLGNPGNFNRRVFNSFSDDTTLHPVDRITYSPYVNGSLPGDPLNVTLLNSETNNPEAWKTLQKYVGFSYFDQYTNSGSTITDFFIEQNIEFTSDNIKVLYPIIKIYAKEKLNALTNGNPWTNTTFFTEFNKFLNDQNAIQADMVLEISNYSNKNLPSTKSTQSGVNSSVSGDVTKLSTYNTFQAFNDKWVAGSDLTTRTIFEDFLFQNTANGDVGNSLQVDVMGIAEILKGDNTISILDVIGFIMKKQDNMLFYAMPAYINFYGNQSPTKNSQPKQIDVPNSLFGTYTEVNYLDSRPKFLLIYVGKESEHPQQKDNAFVIYGDDSFDLRNPSTNPVRIPTDITKYNFALSNKVVGFNVDFGIQNQNMFASVEVGMDDKKNTAATFAVRDQMSNGVNGDKIAQQTTSMYSLYKSASYHATIKSLGNVMIQPMMYFNLRHVPLFYGPYLINNVSHSINEREFTTTFEGNRMPKYALPQPNSLATYIKTNYLEKYQQEILQTPNPATTVTPVETSLDQDASVGTTLKPEDECQLLVDAKYETLPFVGMNRGRVTYSEMANKINAVPGIDRYVAIMMATIAVTRSSNGFEEDLLQPINNNLFEISAANVFADNPVLSELVCADIDGSAVPLFSFSNVTDPINVVYNLNKNMSPLIVDLKNINTGDDEDEKYQKGIVQLIISTWDTGYGYGKTAQEIRDYVLTNVQNNNLISAAYSAYLNIIKKVFTLFP